MKLDVVHDLQSVYRHLVNSTARPGVISNLKEQAVHVDILPECFKSLVLLALTLLDQEASFKVYSEREDVITRQINQFTYAKKADGKQADYIFVLSDAPKGSLEKAIEQAKIGTPQNPHESATVIVEVGEMANEKGLDMKGPGIKNMEQINVLSLENWVEIRQKKNEQFPLGVELIFVDAKDQLLSLPRTTQITVSR
ncbi:phosphonate C-P lyase system protein PhnH [Bacillus sp. FJAT-49705]|uniref:Phosphonate C-P lyase system protein PhnH n=1 Tax=Cytobacillus citreus TaxID=2833586 RepID=A0ABS5NYW7_9BACI|nr:phosphonate C-P lyase system protein PhnH [Cytobacillus citreus]MBS4192563.1 phosphonate C-P lyase system protein PhnH [Cytobacillus citreus]